MWSLKGITDTYFPHLRGGSMRTWIRREEHWEGKSTGRASLSKGKGKIGMVCISWSLPWINSVANAIANNPQSEPFGCDCTLTKSNLIVPDCGFIIEHTAFFTNKQTHKKFFFKCWETSWSLYLHDDSVWWQGHIFVARLTQIYVQKYPAVAWQHWSLSHDL